MNLQKLLDYQEVDKKMYALEMQITNSDENKNLKSLLNTKKECSEEIVKGGKEIEACNAAIAKYKKRYDEMNYEIEELIDVLDSFEEPREIDLYEKKLAMQQKELESIEREISKIARSLDGIEANCKATIAKVIKCNQLIKDNKDSLEKKKAAMMNEVKEVRAQLAAFAKEIPPAVYEKYVVIRKRNKMPVVVPYNKEGKACGGCGMDIDYNMMSKLETEKVIECPNCSRLIYYKNQ